MAICEKCGEHYDSSGKKKDSNLCSECAKKRTNIRMGVGFAVSAVVIGAAGIYLYNNPEIVEKIKDFFKDAPSVFDKNKISDECKAIVQDAGENVYEIKSYLSSLDEKKLAFAEARGAIGSDIVETHRLQLEHGWETADSLLRKYGADQIIELFPNWKDNTSKVSQETFEKLVSETAKNISNLVDARIVGRAILLTIKSNSGRSTWSSSIKYSDENGRILSEFYPDSTYDTANAPRIFAKKLSNVLKTYIENNIALDTVEE